MDPGLGIAGNVFQFRYISYWLCDSRQIPFIFWTLGLTSVKRDSYIRLSLRTPSCCFSDDVRLTQNGRTPSGILFNEVFIESYQDITYSYLRHVYFISYMLHI